MMLVRVSGSRTQESGWCEFQCESRSEIGGRRVSQLADRQSALSLSCQYLFNLMTRGGGHTN